MLLLLSAFAAASAPARGAWVEFDRRPAGWDNSPYEYDSASIRRDGSRVRATYRYKFFYSGLPDPEYRVGIEVDCRRHRSFVYEHLVYSPLNRPPTRPLRLRTPTISTRIVSGSVEASLEQRLCEGPNLAGRND